MQFSPEREAELIEQNMTKICRAADNFLMRCKTPAVPVAYDDMVQQAALAFLLYIRRCETEEQINHFPWHDAINAMCVFVLQSQPFGVPKRTGDFSKILRMIPKTVSYEGALNNGLDVDGISKYWIADKDTQLDFDTFMADQDESLRRIASMKIYGMPNRKIAEQFGVTTRAVDKRITRLNKRYKKFNEEDKSND